MRKLLLLLFVSFILFTGCEPLVVDDYYYVAYHGNGAEAGYPPIDYNEYTKNSTFTVRDQGSLSLTAYTFVGWNTQADLNGVEYQTGDTGRISNSNIDLYAHWIPSPRYSVTYHAGAATSGTVPVDSGSYLEETTVLGNTGNLSLDNFYFAGWSKNEDGSGTLYTEGETLTFRESDINLYAVFTENEFFTIIYENLSNSSDPIIRDKYYVGESFTLRENPSFTWDNYDFISTDDTFHFRGWYVKNDSFTDSDRFNSGYYFAGETITPTCHLYATAIWRSDSGRIINPGFDFNQQPWEFYVNSESGAAADILLNRDSGQLEIDISSPGVSGKDITLTYGVSLNAFKGYRFWITAHSIEAESIKVTISENGYDRDGDGNTNTVYHSFYSPNNPNFKNEILSTNSGFIQSYADPTALITIELGGCSSDVFFDYLSLDELDDEVSVKKVTYDINLPDQTQNIEQDFYNKVIIYEGSDLFTVAGKIFTGWNTEPDGTGERYTGGVRYNRTNNITLYARWRDSDELLTNGSFDFNLNDWTKNYKDDGVTISSPDNGSVILQKDATSNQYLEANLWQSISDLKENTYYTLTLDITSTNELDFFSGIYCTEASTYYDFDLIKLNTGRHTYTVNLLTPETITTQSPLIKLGIYQEAGTVTIHDASLKENTENDAILTERNRDFVLGGAGWLVYKKNDVQANINFDNNECFVDFTGAIPSNYDDIGILRRDLLLNKDYQFVIKFDAKAASSTDISVQLAGEAGYSIPINPHIYFSEKHTIGTTFTNYTIILPNPPVTDIPGGIAFKFGHSNSDITIKNITVEKQLVTPPALGENHISWGEFNNDFADFIMENTSYQRTTPFENINGELVVTITGDAAQSLSHQHFYVNRYGKYDDLVLVEGKKYRVTFDARSSSNRTIQLGTREGILGGYGYASFGTYIDITTTQSTYSVETTAYKDILAAKLLFNCGGESGILYIDNVSVIEIP